MAIQNQGINILDCYGENQKNQLAIDLQNSGYQIFEDVNSEGQQVWAVGKLDFSGTYLMSYPKYITVDDAYHAVIDKFVRRQ